MKLRNFLFVFVLLLVPSLAWAGPSQVEFTGTLEAVDEVEQVLTVRITPTFTLAVRVTAATEIRDGEEQLDFLDLELDSLLRIEGDFTDEGIVAREIEVVESADDLELRGVISEIDLENRTILVNGFLIHVPEDADIKGPGGPMTFEELEVDQHVKVEASVVDDQLVASEVKVQAPRGERFARISFEGIVVSLSDDMIEVLIEDLETPVGVQFSETTEIKGDLEVGVLVRVIGRLNEDLTVTADRILVKRLLQLGPPRLDIQVGQTRRVQVVLRSPVDLDVELSVESEDPTVAEAAPDEVVVAAGMRNGHFEVTGITEGTTTVVVSLPESFGGLSVELDVRVREAGADDDGENGEGPFALKWAPAQLNLLEGQERQAKLMVQRPVEEDTEVTLSLHEGDEDVVSFPATALFEAGSRFVDVEIEAEGAGDVVIRAELPTGEIADLKVRVR